MRSTRSPNRKPRTRRPQRSTTRRRVLLRHHFDRTIGEYATVNPVDKLGPLWEIYLDLVRGSGAWFDPREKHHRVRMGEVTRLIAELEMEGIEIVLGTRLRRRVDELTGVVAPRPNTLPTVPALPPETADVGPLSARLFPYQRQAVAWLRSKSRRLLSLPMGCGKTVISLAALPSDARAVVIVPASVKGSWEAETQTWRPDLTPEILSGRGSFRWPDPGELVIANGEILTDAVDLEPPPEGVHVIADECHSFKSPKAQRTKRFRALRSAVIREGGSVWGMTGTPILGKGLDLRGVLESLDLMGEVWADGSAGFADSFDVAPAFLIRRGQKVREIGDHAGSPSPDVPTRLRRAMLRRERSELLPQLPSKRYQRIPVPMSVDARSASQELLEALADAGLDLDDVASTLESAASKLPKLLATARAALAVSKTEAALAIAERYEEEEEPLVVFSDHRAPVEALGKREGWGKIMGGTPTAKRTEIVKAFQAGQLRGIAGTIPAMGVGLTLTRACTSLFIDRNWTPALNAQAEDRIYRIGQNRGVVIADLVVDHMLDERIYETLLRKQALIDSVLVA